MDRIVLIVEHGYFAEELPPGLATRKFASEFDVIMQESETKQGGCPDKFPAATKKQTSEGEAIIKMDHKNKLAYSACET